MSENELEQYRYLVITELFLPTKGGTAVWFDEVYQRIGGKDIHIVTKDVPGATDYDKDHGNSVHRVPLKRYWWLRPESLAMYLRLLWVSLKVALSNRFDAVHAGRVLPEGLVGWLVARLIRKPLVIYAHGEEITTWRQSAKFRVMQFSYRHADKIIANSRFTKTELEKIGIASNKITIISPGVNIERFRPMEFEHVQDLRQAIGISAQQKLVLSVGRLSRRKGFDQMIRAIAKLSEKGLEVHYALIGIGEDEHYLKQIVEQEGLVEQVHLLGHVSMDDLPRWHNCADVFAMPNREINGDTEGFGMVFIEAAACGKPTIAGNAGGTGDAVLDNDTGFIVDGNKLDDIVAALFKLLSNDALAKDMGRRGLEHARENHAWRVIAAKTMNLKPEKGR